MSAVRHETFMMRFAVDVEPARDATDGHWRHA